MRRRLAIVVFGILIICGGILLSLRLSQRQQERAFREATAAEIAHLADNLTEISIGEGFPGPVTRYVSFDPIDLRATIAALGNVALKSVSRNPMAYRGPAGVGLLHSDGKSVSLEYDPQTETRLYYTTYLHN